MLPCFHHIFVAVRLVVLAPALLLLASVAAQAAAWPTVALTLEQDNLSSPVHVPNAGDGSGRLFIVEQEGRIRIRKAGALLNTPFLDISGIERVLCCGEEGLLSVAFPPGYAGKQYFYVFYTNIAGDLVIARYHATGDPDIADSDSEEILLTIPHPGRSNHNGGQLAFGPNGYLYISTGDGGGGGDPNNNGQNTLSLLGKILRIDVESGTDPYAIPATNPYKDNPLYRPEIWAVGVRNPWRFGFDRQTGDLYIGDVGQNIYEEIDFQPASSPGGENYGWRCREGKHDYNGHSSECAGKTLTGPVTEYAHGADCSVTGGSVYRGVQFSTMHGIYFYGDFCSGRIRGLRWSGTSWATQMLLDSSLNISSFGEDESGELYVIDLNGAVYKISDPTIPTDVDLSGTWESAQQTCKTLSTGLRCTVAGAFISQNQGTQRPSRSSFVRVYLSTDTVWDAGDTLLQQGQTGRLNPGATKRLVLQKTLAPGISASGRYLIARVDANNVVGETDETDNEILFGPVP